MQLFPHSIAKEADGEKWSNSNQWGQHPSIQSPETLRKRERERDRDREREYVCVCVCEGKRERGRERKRERETDKQTNREVMNFQFQISW